MLTGIHAIVYSKDAAATRTFLSEVLGLSGVDAGRGWMIFALPPAEIAAHPDEKGGRHEFFLMCEDIERTVAALRQKGVEFTSGIADRGWGLVTSLRVPGAGEISLYQPKHPTAIGAKRESRAVRRAKKSTRPRTSRAPRVKAARSSAKRQTSRRRG